MLQLGDAPVRHELAAHLVDRHRIAFQEGDGDAAAGEDRGQGRRRRCFHRQ
jgi:hypothetical protein